MDYIYGKLDNNLVDINRIEYIQLKVCNLDNNPIEGLKSGQYYLETKIIDSDLLIYTDLSALNKDDDNITSKLEQEIQDRINQDNILKTNIDNEATRTDNMINQVNENIKVIVDQLNQNIATIVETINTNLDNESKERLRQDTILDNRITEEVNKINDSAISDKDEINKRIDEEVATLNSTISSTKQELQTNIDAVDKDLQDKYEYAMDSVSESFDQVRQTIIEETTRATQAENTLQSNIDTETQERQEAISTLTERIAAEEVRAAAEEANLDKEIKAEAAERINADNDLSQRIENLEGKTTRLYYGEGTLASPTATEIQQFITNLEVNPPYEPPYSGIAVVVKLTDENTYHIWHYYTNLSTWKDDGVDLVSSFTNTSAGIITGTSSVGYISAVNGYGKVNGWEELNATTSNNYTILNEKIDSSISTINTTISSLSIRLDNKIDTETSDRISAISSLSNTLTTSLNNEISRAQQVEETLATTISTSVSTINQTISTLCVNLTSSIEAEAQRATTKENEIISSLSLETQARINGDNTLSSNLNKEIQDRKSGDTTLQNNIDNEASTRASADSTLQSNIDNVNDDLEAEVNRATQAEQAITTNLSSHTSDTSNPHSVTKSQVGLGNVDNTSDLNKPISTATQAALDSINDVLDGINTSSNSLATLNYEIIGEI